MKPSAWDDRPLSNYFLYAAAIVESGVELYGCVTLHHLLKNSSSEKREKIREVFHLFLPAEQTYDHQQHVMSWWGNDRKSRVLALLFCAAIIEEN